MATEPGATEGPTQAPKTTTEPFARETGDISSFAKASEHLSSLVGQADVPELKHSDWRSKLIARHQATATTEPQTEDVGAILVRDQQNYKEGYDKIANLSAEPFTREKGSDNPDLQKAMQELGEVAENVAVQDAAVGLVEGYVNWAKTTGDTRVAKLLSGNIAGIVQRFATNPDKVSDTVAAWTEEEAQTITKDLEDKGIISKKSSTTEPPTTTAK
jgi:hypothetical protein